MKHALRIFAAGAALLAVACTKEQSDGERIPESFPSDSHYVNVDEARAAVETMLGSMDPETRGGAALRIRPFTTFSVSVTERGLLLLRVTTAHRPSSVSPTAVLSRR